MAKKNAFEKWYDGEPDTSGFTSYDGLEYGLAVVLELKTNGNGRQYISVMPEHIVAEAKARKEGRHIRNSEFWEKMPDEVLTNLLEQIEEERISWQKHKDYIEIRMM